LDLCPADARDDERFRWKKTGWVQSAAKLFAGWSANSFPDAAGITRGRADSGFSHFGTSGRAAACLRSTAGNIVFIAARVCSFARLNRFSRSNRGRMRGRTARFMPRCANLSDSWDRSPVVAGGRPQLLRPSASMGFQATSHFDADRCHHDGGILLAHADHLAAALYSGAGGL